MGESSAFSARLKRELHLLEREPTPGISVWPVGDRMDVLQACVKGTMGTPYSDGFFHLQVCVPPRYPFEPPRVKFITPVYHPNIDSSGRICLNILNMPPKGGWRPSLNISTVLASVQVLLSEPNPDDALMVDISEQFVKNRLLFNDIARKKTLLHATRETVSTEKDVTREPQPEASSLFAFPGKGVRTIDSNSENKATATNCEESNEDSDLETPLARKRPKYQ